MRAPARPRTRHTQPGPSRSHPPESPGTRAASEKNREPGDTAIHASCDSDTSQSLSSVPTRRTRRAQWASGWERGEGARNPLPTGMGTTVQGQPAFLHGMELTLAPCHPPATQLPVHVPLGWRHRKFRHCDNWARRLGGRKVGAAATENGPRLPR